MSCRHWPIRPQRFCLIHNVGDKAVEIRGLYSFGPQNPFDGCPHGRFDILTMRLGPVDLEITLDHLYHLMNQGAEVLIAVNLFIIGLDRIIESQLLFREPEQPGPMFTCRAGWSRRQAAKSGRSPPQGHSPAGGCSGFSRSVAHWAGLFMM